MPAQNAHSNEEHKLIIDKLKEMKILTDFVLGDTPSEKEKLDAMKKQLNKTLETLEKENNQQRFDANVDQAIKLIETIYVTVGNFDEIKDRILPLLSLRNKLDTH